MGAAALAGVFAFAVFADYDPVKVAGVTVLEGRDRAPEDAGWADVGVLLEGLADGEAEAPEGDVVRNVWRTAVSGFEPLCAGGAVPSAPTAPKKMALYCFSDSMPPSGMYLPCFL